jgi:hypothetical protein
MAPLSNWLGRRMFWATVDRPLVTFMGLRGKGAICKICDLLLPSFDRAEESNLWSTHCKCACMLGYWAVFFRSDWLEMTGYSDSSPIDRVIYLKFYAFATYTIVQWTKVRTHSSHWSRRTFRSGLAQNGRIFWAIAKTCNLADRLHADIPRLSNNSRSMQQCALQSSSPFLSMGRESN